MKRILMIILFLLLLAGNVAGFTFYHYIVPGPLTQPATFIYSRGLRLNSLVNNLAASGIIRHPLTFELALAASGHAHALKAGEYRFPAGASVQEIIDMMAEGKIVIHKLTIAEGLSAREVAALLNAQPELTGQLPAAIPEGSILPETYQFVYGDSRTDVLKRMQTAMRKLLAELWLKRQPGLPFETPEQALTLASIVEKETGVESERGQVARVFINRLGQHMPLQSDPTTRYGLTLNGVPMHPLTGAELHDNLPYNTYVIPGLPPGPIANPGRAALMATLNPPAGDELYFVATGTGGHYFSRTLEEHNRHVQEYRERARAP